MLKPQYRDKLFQHQKEALALLRANPRFALFMEQGTSKTLPVLMRILELLRAGEAKNALVVCTPAVCGGWGRDIDRFFNPLGRVILRSRITMATYDIVWRRPELEREWDIVVLDESHFIKSRTSCRYAGQMKTLADPKTGRRKRVRVSKGVKQISAGATYRYIMTGTPVGNSHWEELWAQFDFLLPGLLGTYREFEKEYCILNQFYRPYKYLNIDRLKEIIAPYCYRRLKSECLDLPEKLPPERYTVDLVERAKYKQMLKNYIGELDLEAKNPLARMVKLRQMCSGHVKGEDGTVHKLRSEKPGALADFLENWEKKLVIFAQFTESIAEIRRILIKKKLTFVTLDGAQKDKAVWRRFQSDPALQVIVCQYQTASEGIDLYAADTIIFYEPTLSSQKFEQVCDRIHRPGQIEKCSYVLFETRGTVEVKIWSALMRHRDFNNTELMAFVREVKL